MGERGLLAHRERQGRHDPVASAAPLRRRRAGGRGYGARLVHGRRHRQDRRRPRGQRLRHRLRQRDSDNEEDHGRRHLVRPRQDLRELHAQGRRHRVRRAVDQPRPQRVRRLFVLFRQPRPGARLHHRPRRAHERAAADGQDDAQHNLGREQHRLRVERLPQASRDRHAFPHRDAGFGVQRDAQAIVHRRRHGRQLVGLRVLRRRDRARRRRRAI